LPINSINTETQLEIGLQELSKLDHSIGEVIAGLDRVPLRSRPAGFEGLAEIIVGQQVSKASATAIFGRLKESVAPFSSAQFLEAGEQVWIDAGLSRAKQTTLEGLASTLEKGELNLVDLCKIAPSKAMDELTALKGIGPWTAEVFLLFCAGHPDIFPAGDVALQQVVGWLCNCDEKPNSDETRKLAARWAPLRSVAARVCYAEYARRKNRSGIPV